MMKCIYIALMLNVNLCTHESARPSIIDVRLAQVDFGNMESVFIVMGLSFITFPETCNIRAIYLHFETECGGRTECDPIF